MPVDHRRIAVPENTIPYKLFVKSRKKFKERLEEVVKPSGERLDGRKCDEQRKIFLKTDVVSQAKGSAYIEVGETKVIVSVYDPREIPNKNDYKLNGELFCEFKYAPFSCTKRRLHQQDSDEKQKSLVMKRSLESAVCRHEFPNFQVDIYALVLEDNGSALSAAITAAGTALAQAGIPMYDIVTSVEYGIQGSVKLLDPTCEEEIICYNAVQSNKEGEDSCDSHGIIVFSMLSTHQQISGFHLTGNLVLNEINDSIDVLTKATKEIVPLVEKCLVKHVLKTASENRRED